MSAIGTKRTFELCQLMSAFGGRAYVPDVFLRPSRDCAAGQTFASESHHGLPVLSQVPAAWRELAATSGGIFEIAAMGIERPATGYS
jgi:hypothetical protein